MRTHPVLQLPDSPKWVAGALTSDMISPPLSPTSNFDPNRITPAVLSALEYVANKFLSTSRHIRFIVARLTPLPIGQGSNINVIPITALDEDVGVLYERYIRRAAKKYYLSPKWMTILRLGATRTLHWEHIIKRSLVQNDVLFSHEGLTLLNIDHMYSLKHQLNALSRNKADHIPRHIYLESCLYLLRQVMQETQGRPFTRRFVHCMYDHLHIRDDLLLLLANQYEAKYGQEAIVMLKPRSTGQNKPRYFINNRGSLKRQPSQSQKPVTPNTASDVTPITRGEWKFLMEQNLMHMQLGPLR
ncbi:hypothetical protein PRK78_000037 [Emydomyces testavorans]|uniref:DUF7582 domain-containing protein n=1 Tax=Emydomyces testavorans TaxID=2070801 RepID=A0AAF0D9Y3_9EURO|nr:hypothetical protein PRK78_000037 [Emydomyces testavorans]